MARRNLLKKVAPVVMSAAVAFSSMPATAFASDFADSDVVVERSRGNRSSAGSRNNGRGRCDRSGSG